MYTAPSVKKMTAVQTEKITPLKSRGCSVGKDFTALEASRKLFKKITEMVQVSF